MISRSDRLGCSLTNLIELVTTLDAPEIGLKSLAEQVESTTSSGTLVFHGFGAVAEFEWELSREHERAGLAVARALCRPGGRPKTHDAPSPWHSPSRAKERTRSTISVWRQARPKRP